MYRTGVMKVGFAGVKYFTIRGVALASGGAHFVGTRTSLKLKPLKNGGLEDDRHFFCAVKYGT